MDLPLFWTLAALSVVLYATGTMLGVRRRVSGRERGWVSASGALEVLGSAALGAAVVELDDLTLVVLAAVALSVVLNGISFAGRLYLRRHRTLLSPREAPLEARS